jgi:hypothetical protein
VTVIQRRGVLGFREEQPILVAAVHQLGLRGDGGMRAGHHQTIAVGDAQAFTPRPVDAEQVLAEAEWNRMSSPPLALF